MSARIWSTGRKIAGNLVPLAIAAPAGLWGVWTIYLTRDPWSLMGLGCLVLSVVLAWLSINFLGLWGNRAMKAALERRFLASAEDGDSPRYFVGIATPAFRSIWDPHEDVGSLVIQPEQVRFFGDTKQIVLARSNIQKIRRKRNIHSMLFLGGWIALEGVLDGKPIQLLIEPREYSHLLANRKFSEKLMSELLSWKTRL